MNKILLASYGDPHQRERNAKQPDKDAARSLYLQYKSRENRNIDVRRPSIVLTT